MRGISLFFFFNQTDLWLKAVLWAAATGSYRQENKSAQVAPHTCAQVSSNIMSMAPPPMQRVKCTRTLQLFRQNGMFSTDYTPLSVHNPNKHFNKHICPFIWKIVDMMWRLGNAMPHTPPIHFPHLYSFHPFSLLTPLLFFSLCQAITLFQSCPPTHPPPKDNLSLLFSKSVIFTSLAKANHWFSAGKPHSLHVLCTCLQMSDSQKGKVS